MKSEKELQLKIINLIKNEVFKEAIVNQDDVENALNVDTDENHIPHLSIDDLLIKKYSKSSSVVLQSLDCYELISGESIKNISLQNKEFLYPDIILFNYESNQIIIIENKTSSNTGREAITEIYGYANEIRNHLPFYSDYDICFIIISTHFDTLLDHSISSKILSSNVNLLCLKPYIVEDNLNFEIHFPSSWTHLGQNNLPNNALVSYSWCLTKKSNIQFDHLAVIDLAEEQIVTNANKCNSSGFLLIWENGLPSFSDADFVITIYVVNSFAFLKNAKTSGFKTNDNSILAKYINKQIEDHGDLIYPTSLFRIVEDSTALLKEYFDISIESASEWIIDNYTEINRFQRLPLRFNSWGFIGDYVRYFYFHPAVRKHYFDFDTDKYLGHLSPIIGLQIINIITNQTIFKSGFLTIVDVFNFGQQVARYNHVCHNATKSEKIVSRNALLFWSVLELSQSLKEIEFYSNNSSDILSKDLKITLYLNSDNVKPDFRETHDKFAKQFCEIFLNGDLIYDKVFNIAYEYGLYFIEFYRSSFTNEEVNYIESQIANVFKGYLIFILTSVKNKLILLNKEQLEFLELTIFEGTLEDIDLESVNRIIENKSNNFYSSIFLEFLELVVLSTAQPVYHNLREYNIPNSVNWNWMQYSSSLKFTEGMRHALIVLKPNGTIYLSQLENEHKIMGELNNEDEVYFMYYPATGLETIIKTNWEDVKSGKAFTHI